MQKRVDNKLYVFDLTPFVISQDTDAEVIYVQEECINGYKEANASLAEKIEGFNQFVMCVNHPEWAITETGHTLYLDGYDINSHVNLYLDDVQQAEAITKTNIAEGTAIKLVPTESVENYTLMQGAEWDSVQNAWVATMPDADLTITINYYAPVAPLYNISIDEESTAISDITISPQDWTDGLPANTEVNVCPINGYTVDDIDLTVSFGSELIKEADHWSFTILNSDVVLKATYAVTGHNVTFDGDSAGKFQSFYLQAPESLEPVEVTLEELTENTILPGVKIMMVENYGDLDFNNPGDVQYVTYDQSSIGVGYYWFTMPNEDVTVSAQWKFHAFYISGINASYVSSGGFFRYGNESEIHITDQNKTTDDIALVCNDVPDLVFTPADDKDAWTFVGPAHSDISIYATSSSTIELTAPYELEILQVSQGGSWAQMTQDGSDPTKAHGNLHVGEQFSVEQRWGPAQGKFVNMSPDYLTGTSGGVGADFAVPLSGAQAAEITLSNTGTVTINGTDITGKITVKINHNEEALASSYTVSYDDVIEFFPTEDPSYYTVSDNLTYDDTTGNEHWWATVQYNTTYAITYSVPV